LFQSFVAEGYRASKTLILDWVARIFDTDADAGENVDYVAGPDERSYSVVGTYCE
jgi:hypothetical protein